MTTQAYQIGADVLVQSISLSQELLSDILFQINTVDLDNEREYLRNKQISSLTDDIGQFVEITTLMTKILAQNKKIEIPEIKQSHVHLLFVLKAMNQAQQKQDKIALDDLIKYELKDNLTQWKIDFIPQMKRVTNP